MNIKHASQALAIVVGLALGSVLTACIHDSNANNGNSNPVRLLAVSQGTAAASAYDVAMAFHAGGTAPKPQQVSAVSSGTVLGTVMNTDPYNSPQVLIQTTTGVMYQANANTGTVATPPNLYYATTDCSGQAYAIVGDSGGATIPTMVFRNGGNAFVLPDGTVGMVLKADPQVSANALSAMANGVCNPLSLSGSFFYQVNPNVVNSTQLAGANVGAIGFTG